MNYFEFFNIPVAFTLDEAALKRSFYVKSKKYHPDFYTLESEEKQAEILQLSTFNNEAYLTLSDFDKRMKYILELQEILDQEGQNKIPQDFLMEMMDFNEAIMELQFDPDMDKKAELLKQLESLKIKLLNEVEPILNAFDTNPSGAVELSGAKDYYLKKRYLLRIKENLDKFGAPS